MLPQLKTFAALVPSGAGIVSVSSGNLNIRSAPNSGSEIKSKAPAGTYLSLYSKNGDWWYVEYDKGQYGYCHSAYIKQINGSPRKVITSADSLNVRSGAGTDYPVLAKLNKGEYLVVLSSSGYWSKILYYGNKTGYVYNIYLGPVSNNSSLAPTKKLTVPSFKQYDSRWADVKIGSSGKTMAQIGCATTAISMMESFRTGTTITPADMRYKLSYTSSGNVYWPSHYSAVTDKTAYLENIKGIINSGKPVLIGLKNTYEGQHWVVITGYINGGYKASDFIINDPGSDNKTNLQHLLNTHPIFYKYFYY